jgi:hypothetical protein
MGFVERDVTSSTFVTSIRKKRPSPLPILHRTASPDENVSRTKLPGQRVAAWLAIPNGSVDIKPDVKACDVD